MYGYDSRVRVSEVDENRKMTLNAVLNYFRTAVVFIQKIWEWELYFWRIETGCGY